MIGIKVVRLLNTLTVCFIIISQAHKERAKKTKEETGEGKEPCTFPLHCPFCSSILRDTCGNKSKLSRQATVGRGLAVLYPPSLTSAAGSTKQSDIWQHRRNRHKTVLHYGLIAFGWWGVPQYLGTSVVPFFKKIVSTFFYIFKARNTADVRKCHVTHGLLLYR